MPNLPNHSKNHLHLSSKCLLIIILFIQCPFSIAQNEQERQKWQTIFQLDNDLFSGSDRDYTNGIRLGFVQEINKKNKIDGFLKNHLAKLVDEGSAEFIRLRLPDTKDLRFAWGVGFSQLMFTPDNYETLSAPEGERPYAGWLGLEYSLHAKNKNKVNSITLSLGTTGKRSLAEESQEWVHTNISDSPIYQGWDSQVEAEVTVNLHLDFKRRISRLSDINIGGLELDGYYQSGVELGNFRTSASIGMLMRIGHNLPANYSAPRVQLGSHGHELFRKKAKSDRKLSVLAFAGTQVSLVGHDITLDGPVFGNSRTHVSSKPFVGEWLIGFGARYKDLEFSFAQTARSKEFSSQNKHQIFGSFMIRLYSAF